MKRYNYNICASKKVKPSKVSHRDVVFVKCNEKVFPQSENVEFIRNKDLGNSDLTVSKCHLGIGKTIFSHK